MVRGFHRYSLHMPLMQEIESLNIKKRRERIFKTIRTTSYFLYHNLHQIRFKVTVSFKN